MLCVDHIVAGIILPSLFEEFQNVPAISISVISSVLPDISGLHGWHGNIKYLSHRKSTHSLIFAPLFSIIPLVLIYLILGDAVENTLMELYSISLLSMIFHIVLDIVTPFGTQILYPLSDIKASVDLLPSFEPITISISTIFIISFFINIILNEFPNFLFFLIFGLLYFLYGVFYLILKLVKTKKFKRYLTSKYSEAIYINTVPRTFWRWKGIGKNSSAYIVMSDVTGEDECKLYSTETPIPDKLKVHIYYEKFMNYARFPVVLNNKVFFSLINLIYSPYSFRFDFEIDEEGRILFKRLSGFKLSDSGI